MLNIHIRYSQGKKKPGKMEDLRTMTRNQIKKELINLGISVENVESISVAIENFLSANGTSETELLSITLDSTNNSLHLTLKHDIKVELVISETLKEIKS